MSDEYKRMFEAAIGALAQIDYALGLDADGCNDTEQTLFAIAELRGEAEALREELAILRDSTNALLHQIDIGDFVDDHGHSAKMLKPVHDLMRILTANAVLSGWRSQSD